MLSLHDPASRANVLRLPLEPALHNLIDQILLQAALNGLLDLTHIVVIQPGDTESHLIDELGWSPLVDLFNDVRFGTEAFMPYWNWLSLIDGWFRMIVTIGNAGFAYVLLIPDREDILPDILSLCRTYCTEGRA